MSRDPRQAVELSIVTLVNDDRLYAQCRTSLENACEGARLEFLPIQADAAGWNAGTALAHGVDQACGRWIACVHQDVIAHAGWWTQVQTQIETWTRRCGRAPAIAGLVGATRNGRYFGAVHDPMGYRHWGSLPHRVLCLDEHVLLLRSGIASRFDPANPGFHCYGADIALDAAARGEDVIAIDAPVTHLSAGRIDDSFREAADWLLGKWGETCGGVIPTAARTLVANNARRAPRRYLVSLAKRTSWMRNRVGRGGHRVPRRFCVSLSNERPHTLHTPRALAVPGDTDGTAAVVRREQAERPTGTRRAA